MGFTIYTLQQVTERYRTVHGAGDTTETVEVALPEIVVPAGTEVIYEPPGLDRFSAEPPARSILLADPHGTASTEQILAAFPAILDAKYNKLWQAAHDYEQRFISGVGLAILSLGVAKGKPKALAVADWSNGLWMNYYYPRKAGVTIAADPDCDFSAAGSMPYGVPELAAEVYGG